MRILQKNNPEPKPWEGVWKCPECRSIIELDAGDQGLVRNYGEKDQRDGIWISILCPACNLSVRMHHTIRPSTYSDPREYGSARIGSAGFGGPGEPYGT